MKIIHVVDSLDPAQGGPPMVVARLGAAQAQLGHDVEIVSLESHGSNNQVNVSLEGIPHLDQVTFTLIKRGGPVDQLLATAAGRYLTRRVPEADAVHLHNMWRPLLVVAAKTAKRAGVKYVIAPHGALSRWSLGQKRWKKQVALALGWRKILNEAFFIHALNADEVRESAPLQLQPPVEIIPNGVFPEEIDNLPEKSTFRGLYPQLKDRPYILFLGRLHYKKGLDYLADAFNRFARQTPSADLVVVGPDGGAGQMFEERIAQFGLTGRVHMVGPLYGFKKYAAMVDALCICLPSRDEGFSMTITEAMGCGLPVVISRNCNFPEVAELEAGEVVDLDAAAISAALLRMATDENWRHRAGQAARQLVLSRFTWPTIAQKSIIAYNTNHESRRDQWQSSSR